MIYANAKKMFRTAKGAHDLDLISHICKEFPRKTPIVFVVGDNSHSVTALLSSMFKNASVFKKDFAFDEYEMFKANGKYISPLEFVKYAEYVSSFSNIPKSPECISLAFSLMLAKEKNCGILIYDCPSTDFFFKSASALKSKICIAALSDNHGKSISKAMPENIKECILLSDTPNYDYISNIFNGNGTRMTFVSPNKLLISKQGLTGSNFFYNGEPFETNVFEPLNIALSALATETARAAARCGAEISEHDIRSGLYKADLPFEFDFYSLSPVIALKAIKNNSSKEEISASVSYLEKLIKSKVKIFSNIESSDHPYDRSVYLRKNISSFIKEYQAFPVLFIGDLNFVSKIKKELRFVK